MRLVSLLICLMLMSLTVFAESKKSKSAKKTVANLRTKEIAPVPQIVKIEPRKAKAVGPHPLIGEWQMASNVCKSGDDFQAPSGIEKSDVKIKQMKTVFKADGTAEFKLLSKGQTSETVIAGTFEIENQNLSLEITSVLAWVNDKPVNLKMRVPSVPKFALKEEKLLIEDTQSYGRFECPKGSHSYLVYNRTPDVNAGTTTIVNQLGGATVH